MANPFVYRLRVRFCECDPQKVAFNGNFALYIDLAVFEFMRALGFGESLVKGPLDYQVVKQTVEWKGPARFDQVVEVSVWAKQLGTTSFVIATAFRIAGNETIIATGETVYVLVDAAKLTKVPLLADFRAALERGAPGLCIDHANCSPQKRSDN
ncbi:MAG TPA: thioesterase family protein [Planctomycetaceae bacterium]|jgi:acyl-CoA thioester hydrolase|nr:thioesterase family protein [Planctomycetaceae bacterium]